MEQRISFITLGVADLDRARGFYEALGWTASSYGQGQGIVFFQAGGMVIGLFPRGDLAKDAGVADAPGGGFSGITLSHNTRTEAQADDAMALAIAAGAAIVKPLQRASWGGYVGYFKDLDGHLWEVCHNPDADIAADGSIHIPK